MSDAQPVDAAADPTHDVAHSRWGATLHLICASRQRVAAVQSCHVRFTPRLNDAKPQRTDGRTDGHTDRQREILAVTLHYIRLHYTILYYTILYYCTTIF